MFPQSSIIAINHLLAQNSWAPPRLAHFFGKTVCFEVAPFFFAYTICADGMLRAAASNASADMRCVIAPSLLPRLALHDEQAYAEIKGEGDAALLAEIFFLTRNLRWDAAEDLSKVTGDIAAERIVKTAQSVSRQVVEAVVNLSQAASEYWTEEQPLVAKPDNINMFVSQVDILRDDIARLEQRLKHL